MKKQPIDRKFREIHCGRCGTCCSEPIVPVTDSDVRRICNELKVPPQKVVTFYTPEEMDYDKDAEVWINFSSGKKAMGLIKKNDRCLFLSSTISCKIYPQRPMTCRTFPYMIDFDTNGDPERVRKNNIVDCKSFRKGLSFLDSVVSNVRIEMNEDEKYYEKIAEWNKKKICPDTEEFLQFLKLI